MHTATSRIVTLLTIGELTIIEIAEVTGVPIAKVGDAALRHWCELPERANVAVTRHTQKGMSHVPTTDRAAISQ